jgi:AraC-like DNA-binding protein
MEALRFPIPVLYLRHLAEQVGSMGGDVSAWLRRSGLRLAQLDDPSLTIALPVFQSLVLGAVEATGEPALGLFVGQRLGAASHGALGLAAMSAGTVGEATDLLVRFGALRLPVLSVASEVIDTRVRVRFDEAVPLGPIKRPVLEAVVLSIKNVLDVISMGACRVEAAHFPFAAPAYAEVARALLGCPVRYDEGWAGLSLPVQALEVRLRMADPAAAQEAAAICQRALDQLRAESTTAAAVMRLLLDRHGAFPSLQIAARRLHTTPRTLHRRLVAEGTSYRALLESVRHTLAVEQVKSGRFTIEEIAYTLGYTDLANFRRAFKRWERVPPSALRLRG